MGDPAIRHPALALIKSVLRLFYPSHCVSGAENVTQDHPAVFVCNHADTYAPIVTALYFPYPFRPWIHAHLTDPEMCRDHLEKEFAMKSLRLRPPLSSWAARALAPAVIRLMKALGAVPVHKDGRKILRTFRESLDILKDDGRLMIYPEKQNQDIGPFVNGFHTGFVQLARMLHRECGGIVRFYPVCVHPGNRTIGIGRPVAYRPGAGIRGEKNRICALLADGIREMAGVRPEKS